MPTDLMTDLTRECAESGCSGRPRGLGLCGTHYARVYRAGGRPARVKREGCSVDGCDREHFGLGYCVAHYTRVRKHGDPGPAKVKAYKGRGSGYINTKGYRVLADTRLEHRVVMESMLGRPLAPDEQVHHRNGVRADNRPENLELWVVSQPAGQRVEDALDHALSIVRRYAPYLLPDEVGE